MKTTMFSVVKTAMGKVTLVVFSAAMTLLLLEFSIRAFFPQPINRYNFTMIQLDGGGEMVLGRTTSPRRDRLEGYGPYIPNLSTKFGGVAVKINSRGWRDAEYSLEKPAGVTRIMIIGDSVTFGYAVELEDTFQRVLERGLNRQGRGNYEVLSLGGAGSNTYSQREVIKQNVPIYHPDLVILAFNLNDILPKIVGKPNAQPGARHFLSRAALRLRRKLDAAFRSRSHLYFLFRDRIKIVLRHFKIVAPTMVPLPAFDIESDHGVVAWRDTSEALLEIAAQLRKERVPFLVAILPVDMQLSPKIADNYRREYGFVFADSLVAGKPQKIIADFARQHGIACLDLLPAFRKAPGKDKFFRVYGGSVDWNHPNAVGHKIIAVELQRAVRARGGTPNGNRKTGEPPVLPNTQRVKLRPVVSRDG